LEKKLQARPYFLPAQYPNAEIEVWIVDEHRLSLHPIRIKEVDTVASTAERHLPTKVLMDVVIGVCTSR
jgi:hypothetical protein